MNVRSFSICLAVVIAVALAESASSSSLSGNIRDAGNAALQLAGRDEQPGLLPALVDDKLPMNLSDQEVEYLVEFLKALSQ